MTVPQHAISQSLAGRTSMNSPTRRQLCATNKRRNLTFPGKQEMGVVLLVNGENKELEKMIYLGYYSTGFVQKHNNKLVSPCNLQVCNSSQRREAAGRSAWHGMGNWGLGRDEEATDAKGGKEYTGVEEQAASQQRHLVGLFLGAGCRHVQKIKTSFALRRAELQSQQ